MHHVPPLSWRQVKQEAQRGFQELLLQAGLPVSGENGGAELAAGRWLQG